MYHLLQESPLHYGGGLIFPDFRRIRDGLQLSIDRIKQYRRINPRMLKGGHFLLRLLGSIPVSQKLDAVTYNDKIADIALLFTQSLGMNSALSKGRVFRPGDFLGNQSTEVYVANTDTWDVEAGVKNWEELAPIRYLWHPMSTLKLPVADGQFASATPGVTVISINVPMLASQYRMWRLKYGGLDESVRTPGHFLQAYPLPNMLDSQIDIAILNRLMGRYFGTRPVVEPYRHPFYLTDWSSEVDRVLDKFLEQTGPKRWDFDTLVSHIPTVSSENLHDVLRLPEMPFSTQLQWSVVLARVNLVAFLVQFNRSTNNSRNQQYLNYIKRWLKYMEGSSVLRSSMPSDLYEDLTILIDYAIRPYLD